jgi:hypothetical protein
MDTHATALARLGRDLGNTLDPWRAEGIVQAQILAASGRAAATDITVLPDIVNVTAMQGADLTLTVLVEDLDLSGRDVLAEIRTTPSGPAVGLWVPTLITTTDEITGEPVQAISLYLAADLSALLPLTTAWDVWLCDVPRTCLVRGTLTLQPRITVCPPTSP